LNKATEEGKAQSVGLQFTEILHNNIILTSHKIQISLLWPWFDQCFKTQALIPQASLWETENKVHTLWPLL
jgi:hypothetical protein